MAIGVFIDGEYLSRVFPGRMDFMKLRQTLESELGDFVDEGYYFNADEDPPKATKLHNKLAYPPPDGPGLRVKVYWLSKKPLFWPRALGGKPVLHPDDQTKQYELTTQKAVDVGLVYHLTRSFLKRHWTKLVLAAGDADFHEPIQNLVEGDNVDLYLVGTISSISQDLRPYARKIFEVDKSPLKERLQL
jgi:uncharacterized LabA/DUF88 family protein